MLVHQIAWVRILIREQLIGNKMVRSIAQVQVLDFAVERGILTWFGHEHSALVCARHKAVIGILNLQALHLRRRLNFSAISPLQGSREIYGEITEISLILAQQSRTSIFLHVHKWILPSHLRHHTIDTRIMCCYVTLWAHGLHLHTLLKFVWLKAGWKVFGRGCRLNS